jgi:hypothetical protein
MGARIAFAVGLVAAALAFPVVAFAHESVDSGNYHFEIGWLNEPVAVGERNGLDLFVAPKDKPDQGLSDINTLQFTVEYGGASGSYDIVPVEDDPGHYQAVFVPTREGKYTFHISGSINGDPVDVSVEPDEVQPVGSLSFPGSQGAPIGQSARFGAPQAQTRTVEILSIAGLAFGVVGTALGVFGVMRKK